MNAKKLLAVALAMILVLGLLAGCGSAGKGKAAYEGTYAAAYDYEYPAGGFYEEAADVAYSTEMLNSSAPVMASKRASGSTSGIPLPENRKWIINMDLSTETADLDAALASIGEKISALQGYVEGQNINNGSTSSSYRRRSASLTVRIPADKVDSFVEEVGGITNVVSSSRYVQDITLAYTDTEGRLNSLRTEEARLLELMGQAMDMSDLLEIESRLTEVRYQLESYGSTLRLYDNQVDYATVSLYVSEVKQYTPTEKVSFWQRITDGLSTSIVDLGEAIVNFIAGVIIDLPYLIVLALLVWAVYAIIRHCIRKRKVKKAAAKKAAEDSAK